MTSSSCLDSKLKTLLSLTIEHEHIVAERDREVFLISQKYAALDKLASSISQLQGEIEAFYAEHRAELEPEGKKCLQLTHGLVGMRAASNPALVPISDKWDWAKIARKLKRLYKTRFFHKPKPPAVDKVKIKTTLDAEKLAECGMKLDDTEHFYLELARLPLADETKAA